MLHEVLKLSSILSPTFTKDINLRLTQFYGFIVLLLLAQVQLKGVPDA